MSWVPCDAYLDAIFESNHTDAYQHGNYPFGNELTIVFRWVEDGKNVIDLSGIVIPETPGETPRLEG